MKSPETKYGFGPHLMLECSGCSEAALLDRNIVLEVLEKLPAKIGMKKELPSHIFNCPPADTVDGGLSGIVLVFESHMSVHTFPKLGKTFIDIFSWKEFDIDFAVSYLMKSFGATSHDAQVYSRGYNASSDLGRQPLVIEGEVKR